MVNDGELFEFNAPKTITDLYEMANSNDDGADEFFDMSFHMKSAKSESNLESISQNPVNFEEDLQENKENFALHDQFNNHNINFLAHQLIHSAKKPRTSKLFNRHSITVEGIELELPKIKHHAMITRLDELEETPKLNLRSRSVVMPAYKYEHIESGSQENVKLDKSSKKCMTIAEKVRHFFHDTPPRFRSKPTVHPGSNVFKSRSPFYSFESISSDKNQTIDNEHIKSENDSLKNRNNQHVNSCVLTSAIKPIKSQMIEVLNSQDGVQVVETKTLGHGGIKIPEKQLHTIPKPFSFETRKSCAVKSQNIYDTSNQWIFKARPATVLRKKPFMPKHEKKYTEPKKICLNTEKRAHEWLIFEQELKEKFSCYEKSSKMKQEEMKKKEMNMIKCMRQQTIHKPEPIKKYKPVLIRKSQKPITVPHSPRFSIRPVKCCLNVPK